MKSATAHGEIQEADRPVCDRDNSSCVYNADDGKKSSDPANKHMEEDRTKVTKRLRLVKKTFPTKSAKKKPKDCNIQEAGDFTNEKKG